MEIAPDGSIVLAGLAATDATNQTFDFGVVRLVGDTVFANGF